MDNKPANQRMLTKLKKHTFKKKKKKLKSKKINKNKGFWYELQSSCEIHDLFRDLSVPF